MVVQAVHTTVSYIQATMDAGLTSRSHLHIVVGLQLSRQEDWHGDFQQVHPNDDVLNDCVIVHRRSVGDPKEWMHPYDDIATLKADLSARTGLPTRLLHTPEYRHLLRPTDVRYWGSVIEEGLVVACSGVQPDFDEHYAETILGNIKRQVQVALLQQEKEGVGITYDGA